MDFTPTSPDYENDSTARIAWESLRDALGNVEGLAFYKHPVLGGAGEEELPDLTVLARGYEPMVIRCIRHAITDITKVADDTWTVDGDEVDSSRFTWTNTTHGSRTRLSTDGRRTRRTSGPASTS